MFSSMFLRLGWMAVFSGVVIAQSSLTSCNNSPDLCQRSYGNITHLGAHDSPFLRDESTSFSTSGNQFFNSTAQLDAGVRLLSTQLHFTNSSRGHELRLCHFSCDLLDAGGLRDWLSTIKAWLDQNPNEVVTLVLVNSDRASAAELAMEFESSAIVPYTYVPPSISLPQVWPTLSELITTNQRLLTFVTNLPTSQNTVAPYLMDQFAYVFETPFQNTSPSDFNCTVDRPSIFRGEASSALHAGLLPLQNHFLYSPQVFGIEVPDVDRIEMTNSPNTNTEGQLGFETAECMAQWGRAPTFILVDFFNVGPAIQAVDALNGIVNPIGRQAISTEVVQRSTISNQASAKNGNLFALLIPIILAIVWFN